MIITDSILPYGQADLKIYSLSGKLVDQKQFETINSFYLINLSNLSNGVYLFHIELSNGVSTTTEAS